MYEQNRTGHVILRRKEVEERTGFSRSTIYQKIAEGSFPQPLKLTGTRSVGWLESEIAQWIEDCVQARRPAPSGPMRSSIVGPSRGVVSDQMDPDGRGFSEEDKARFTEHFDNCPICQENNPLKPCRAAWTLLDDIHFACINRRAEAAR